MADSFFAQFQPLHPKPKEHKQYFNDNFVCIFVSKLLS